MEAGYGDSQVLFGIDFSINSGEVITLLGRNGMGKTTTVLSLVGLVPPRAGEIRLDGMRLDGLPPYRIARAGLGLVPEGRQIFPNLSARENLLAAAANRFASDTPWALDAVLDLFPALAERLSTPGALLSGGEQQMLAIGRALMTNPRLLILDEANEGLAPLLRQVIWQALARLRSRGQSILLIDKNLHELTHIADRHYILEKGEVVWTGNSGELRGAGHIVHRYLGI